MPPGERGRKRGWLREPGRLRTRRAARRHRAARSHPGHRCCRSPWQRRQNAVWARTDQGPDGPQKNASKAQHLGRNHHYFKNIKTLRALTEKRRARSWLGERLTAPGQQTAGAARTRLRFRATAQRHRQDARGPVSSRPPAQVSCAQCPAPARPGWRRVSHSAKSK